MTQPQPFWETTALSDMTHAQWESLCDGCGRCCLHKLRDEEEGSVWFTSVACRLLDLGTCRCSDYPRRQQKIPDCISLTPEMMEEVQDWLPPTCAYRRLYEGKTLPAWHPLRTGRPESVREAGISAAGRCISEREAGDLEDHLADWPGQDPAETASGQTEPAGLP
ncbi:YcgN family cysteine cluster protein [Acetobacter sp. AN02]|uniref:YcgN family cysteine cluster protein n=1 Tax=Acetobacter sp. AN02 TaxID=2894186 RepID=UPI0024345B31|nr:YcgN family cysteine cluster protein [Acetobacter sp. AN02]MDG6094729.1 YcgN family cysteine cluster protein [Acetobacter sp. AN02]